MITEAELKALVNSVIAAHRSKNNALAEKQRAEFLKKLAEFEDVQPIAAKSVKAYYEKAIAADLKRQLQASARKKIKPIKREMRRRH